MRNFVYLIPLFPLLGSLTLMAFGKKLGYPKAGWIGFAAVGSAFLATVVTWLGLLLRDSFFRQETKVAFDWITVGQFNVDVAFLLDPLSLTMTLFVTGVSSLIHLYSIAYMKDDSRYHQFFVYMNLFVFSMIVLVLADNFLLLFLGWEGVGACSYLLVGFWFEKASAATAAKKAFIVNRIGDVGLLLGMFLIFNTFGTLTFLGEAGVFPQVAFPPEATITAIALLLFVGAIGKSAQLPLHVWLPDAMEGPTPVSALIHAATMVTAGVYLMARCAPMLEVSSTAALVVAIVGIASAFFAATIACAQNDIKKVLAYSTMSQLGYMFAAVGASAYVAGIFHMVTHAFFKALLFLCAGAVIHALHEQQDLKKMGNLRKYLPVTYVAFLIGWLAICGIPPFAGFWSKDEILLSLWDFNIVIWAFGIFTVFLTAYYMSRLFFLTFYGKDRWKDDLHDAKPHEGSKLMTIPIVILAGLSAVGGLLNVALPGFNHVLEHFFELMFGEFGHAQVSSSVEFKLAAISVVVALSGIATAWLVARAGRPWPAKLEPKVLARAWFVDPLYELLFAKPGKLLANWSAFFIDNKVVDGAVNGSAKTVGFTATGMRKLQSGYLRSYALTIAGGTMLILVWALVRSA